MKKILGTLLASIIIILSLAIPRQTSAQQVMVGCTYWGENSRGCDRYDCGACIFLACGEIGGVIICGFEEDEESIN